MTTNEIKTKTTIEDISKTLKENNVKVDNKDLIVKTLRKLVNDMEVSSISVGEEIKTLEDAIGAKLTEDQIDALKKRHEKAIDAPKDIRKAIIFSRTCVSHTAKLLENL